MPDVGGAGGLGGCRAIYRLSLPLGISVEGDGLLNLMVSSPLSPPRTSPLLPSSSSSAVAAAPASLMIYVIEANAKGAFPSAPAAPRIRPH